MWFLYDFSRREKGETCWLSLSTLNRKWNTRVIFVRHKTDHASSPLFSQQNLGFQFTTWFWQISSTLLSLSFFADPKTGHVVSPLCLWICGSCLCNVFLFFYLVVTSLYCKPLPWREFIKSLLSAPGQSWKHPLLCYSCTLYILI